MYLEHFHLTHPPFAEQPDSELFFPGAKREEICQSLILDILSGKQLLKLIGREGSGKTLICRLIAERLPSEYQVLVLDNPVVSFDELLRTVCSHLGLPPRGNEEGGPLVDQLRQCLAANQARQLKTVLILDEAEKLFLATAERLLRLLADQQDALAMTVLLAGRPGLESNLDQLAIYCAAIDVHAGYFLEDLTPNETRQYLRFRLTAVGMERKQQENVFSEGVVAQIFASSRGNPRRINVLAEEALKGSCAEKSFMVLLDQVEPEDEDEREFSPTLEQRVIELYEALRFNKPLAGALAGCVVLMLVIGFLLNSNSGHQASPPGGANTSGQAAAPAAGPQPQAVQPAAATGVRPAVAAGRDGDKLFRERLGASATWLAGVYRGGYTIQLMMLGSPQAQAGITNMLVQEDYFQIRDQLYILRKNTAPPTLFMFFGTYDSLDAAREARNNMPVFLRKHHPYPLSISEALKKIEL